MEDINYRPNYGIGGGSIKMASHQGLYRQLMFFITS